MTVLRGLLWGTLALVLATPSMSLAQAPRETIAKFYTRVDEKRNTPFQQALEQAPGYTLMFGTIKPAWVAPLKGRNSTLAVVLYELPGGRFRGEEDFGAVSAHEDWFVHGSSGERIQNENGGLLLDMGNPQFRAYEIDFIVKSLTAASYDGVFLDVVHPNWVQAKRGWSPPIPPPVINGWAANMLSFLEALRAKMPPGKRLWLNALPTREERQWSAWEQKAFAVADGVQMDGFCYNRRNPYSEQNFNYQLHRIAEVAAQGKSTLVKAAVKEGGGEAGRGELSRLESFCFAAYLLVADGKNVLYYPAHELNRARVQGVKIYEAMLGAPLAGFTRVGSLYRREFARGAVIVNPTGSPASLDLGAPMTSAADGRSVTRASLGAYDGLILTKP